MITNMIINAVVQSQIKLTLIIVFGMGIGVGTYQGLVAVKLN
jgi:hypothetical protein